MRQKPESFSSCRSPAGSPSWQTWLSTNPVLVRATSASVWGVRATTSNFSIDRSESWGEVARTA